MNHVPHTCLQEAGAAKGENDFHSNEKKLTDALQTTAEDVLGHADDSEKHEGRVRVAALQTQEHGRAAVLTRLSEPRHDGASGTAVVCCEILYTRCTAAREIQQVFVVAASHIDEQEHAVRPFGYTAHTIEARAHAAAAA